MKQDKINNKKHKTLINDSFTNNELYKVDALGLKIAKNSDGV